VVIGGFAAAATAGSRHGGNTLISDPHQFREISGTGPATPRSSALYRASTAPTGNGVALGNDTTAPAELNQNRSPRGMNEYHAVPTDPANVLPTISADASSEATAHPSIAENVEL
jgi:hypothetical protein